MRSILVVGSSNTDMVTMTNKSPNPGETVQGKNFKIFQGGKGANQAVMANRFGINTYFISCLGNDIFAENTKKHLINENLKIDFLQYVESESGIATIVVDEQGQNQIIVVPGSNHQLDVNQILEDINKIKELKIVVSQFEIQPEIISQIFEVAKKKDLITILNPAPAMHLSEDLIKNTDWLIPNETEFVYIHPNHMNPIDDEIKFLANKLQVNLIVTLGELGAKVCLKNGEFFHIEAKKVVAVDTTAAGDAFVGSFSALLALDYDPLSAIKKACEIASISVTRQGAQSSLPTKVEIQNYLT